MSAVAKYVPARNPANRSSKRSSQPRLLILFYCQFSKNIVGSFVLIKNLRDLNVSPESISLSSKAAEEAADAKRLDEAEAAEAAAAYMDEEGLFLSLLRS
jgi:hypothetical protein